MLTDLVSVKANMLASDEEKLSDAEVIAQITSISPLSTSQKIPSSYMSYSSLTFAATDTTSGALSRILHQLAIHKDVQAKLREEIKDEKRANGGQDLEYDQLVSLPYLDAVCRETLRL